MLSACLCLLIAADVRLAAATKDLDGLWEFRFDPDSQGESLGWQTLAETRGWTSIQVPGSFNEMQPQLSSYQGKAWYRRMFEVPGGLAGGRVILRFEGVALRAKVWVNGRFISQHLFPYTPFELDITEAVSREVPNRLVVLADNEVLENAIPDKKWWGWWNFGGINRRVTVETRPALFSKIASLETTREANDAWQVAFRVTADNGGKPAAARVIATIQEASGRELWKAAREAQFDAGEQSVDMLGKVRGVRPWSPDSPALYYLRTAVEVEGRTVHETTTRFGFRTIAVRGTEILLNESPVFLKGVNLHEMYPGLGMTLSRETTRRDLVDIKALGANFIRVAHYPHARDFYELCDELGLMVWNEIPAWQTRAEALANDQVFASYAEPQLREMIAEYRLHPSVVVWSVANEIDSDRPEGARYVERACEVVRRLDRTRLVTFASSRRQKDISFGPVDFIAVNEYFGHYSGKLDDLGPLLDEMHQKWPDKPIVISEFGTESVLGWSNPKAAGLDSTDSSEDYQVRLIASTFAQISANRRREFMSGAIYWLYADYPWCDRPAWLLKRAPALGIMNRKGVVTEFRRHKRAWAELQRSFRSFK